MPCGFQRVVYFLTNAMYWSFIDQSRVCLQKLLQCLSEVLTAQGYVCTVRSMFRATAKAEALNKVALELLATVKDKDVKTLGQ